MAKKVVAAKLGAKSTKRDSKLVQELARNAAKKRPRGRPFEKGHTFGFKKGQSGHPGRAPVKPEPYRPFKDRLVEELAKPASALMRAKAGLSYKHATKYDCIIASLTETAALGDMQAAFGIRNVIEGLLPTKNFHISADMQDLLQDPEFVEWLQSQHGQFTELKTGGENNGRRNFTATPLSLPSAENAEGTPTD